MMIGARKKHWDAVPGMAHMPIGMAQQPDMGAPAQMMAGYGETPVTKPKFNPWDIVGAAGDALASYGGLGTPYRDNQQRQRAEFNAEEQYKRRSADEWNQYIRKSEYERANPAPRSPHYFETNDGSQGMIDPVTGQPQIVYKDPSPKMQWVPDGLGGGRFAPVYGAPQQSQTPEFAGWADEGGPVQQAPGNFPR
jgi:hypothetical protein